MRKKLSPHLSVGEHRDVGAKARGSDKATTAASSAEGRFQQMTNLMPAIVLMSDPAGNVRFFNRRWLEYTGMTPAETTEQGTWPAIHPDDVARDRVLWSAAIASEQPYASEYRLRRHDGVYRWHLERAEPELDDQGKVVQWFHVATDIEDCKAAEQQVRQTNSRFERAERVANGFVFETDLRSDQVMRSPNFARITGYALEEILPTAAGWTKLIHPDDLASFADKDYLAEGDVSYTVDYRVRHRDGHYFWVQEQGLIERDATGRPVAIVGTTIDITERKRAEQNQQLLDAIGRIAAEIVDEKALLWLVAEQVGEHLDGYRCGFADIDAKTGTSLLHRDWCGASAASVAGSYRNEDFLAAEFIRSLSNDEAVVVADVSQDPRTAPYAANWAPVGIAAFAFVPILRTGKWQALFYVHYSQPHAWRNDEIQLLRDVAARVWPIVERLRAEKTSRASEARLHTILENIPAAVYMLSPDHRYLYVNRLFAAGYNLTSADIVGLSVFDRFPPEVANPLAENEQRVLASRTPLYFEEAAPRNGEVHYYSTVKAPLLTEAGEPYALVGISLDITERKRAEERLRQSEERYRTLFESMDQGYSALQMLYDESDQPIDYRVLEANPAFARITGLAGATGKTGLELVPYIEPAWLALLDSVVRTGESQRFDQYGGALNIWFEVFAFRLDPPEDRRLAVLFTDISERKRAEDEVQRSRNLLQRMAEATPDDISVYDLREQRMIYSNRRSGMSDFSGRAYWNTTPAEIDSHIHPDDVTRVQQEFARLHSAADGEVVETIFRWRLPDGDYRWLQERTVVFARDEQSAVTQHLSISTDITERKQAEQHQQFLSELSMRLQALTDPRQIQQTVVERLGQYLGASRCRFNAIDLAADRAERLAEWLAPGESPTSDLFPFSEYASPVYIAHAQAGQTLVIDDAHQDERTELAQALLRKYGAPATIRVPCIRQGQWVASLHVLHSTPRHWHPAEVQLVENVAYHFWPLVEKARAEAALRRQEKFVRQIADNVPGLVGYVGADERYRFVNRTYEQWFQRPRQQIIDHTLREVLGEEIYNRSTYRNKALAGESVTFEDRYKYPDGVRRAVWGRYYPDIAADGAVLGFYLFVMDVSERKQAEADARFLADIAEMIRLSDDPQELLVLVTDRLAEYLAVGRAYFTQQDAAQDRGLIPYQYSRSLPPVANAYRLSRYKSPLKVELREGRTLVCDDAQTDPRTQAVYKELYAPDQERAWIDVPLRRQGQLVATLSVTAAEARHWQPREIHLLETIAERAWLAVEKLRLGAELRQNEERLRLALTAAQAGGWSYDLVTDTAYWSSEMFALYGISPDRPAPPLGEFAQLIHPAHRQYTADEVEAAVSRGGNFAVEFRVLRPDGQEIWIRSSGIVVLDDQGRPVAARGIDQDISQHKAAELALQQSNAILSGVLESSADAIFVRDLTGRFLLVNSTAAEQVQISRETMIGKRYDELFTPAEVLAIRQDDHPVFDLGQSVTFEHTSQYQGLTRYWHTLKMPLRNAAGEIIGLISSARDISERKRAELHQQFLAELFSRLRLLDQTGTMFEQLVTSLGQYLAVSSCRINAIDLTRAEFTVQKNWGGNDVRIGHSYSLDDLAPPAILAVLQAGETVVVTSTASDPRTALVATAFTDEQVSAFMGVPIFYGGEWQATISVKAQGERHWRADEVRLLETVAGQFGALLEKARAEETLRSSEERLRLALEAGNLAVFEYNIATNLVHRSASAQHIQGLGEYGDGSEQLQYLYPLDRAAFSHAVEAITPQRPNYECEYRLRRPDTGQQVWLLERGQGFFSEPGELQRVVGAVLDIGDRKQREAEGRFLSELSEVMVKTQATEELLWNVARHLAEFLDVARSFFIERDPDQEAVIVHRNYYQPGLSSIEGVYPVADFDPESLAAQAAGRIVTVYDTQSPPVPARGNQSRYEAMGIGAMVAAPLLRAGQWAATLLVIDNQPRQWSAAEVRLIQTVAERAWLGVENRRLLAESQEKQRFLQSIADTTPNLLYLFDLRTLSNRYVNRQMITMLGYTPGEVQARGGQVLQELMHPTDLAYLADHQQRLRQLHDGEVAEWEYRLCHKDGTWRWLGSHETVFERDAAGEPTVILGAVQDITARKTADIQLRDSEARYRHLADAMPQIVWRTQANGRVDYLNQQWFQYTGLTEEISYADPNQVIHADDIGVAETAWQQAQAGETAYEYEMRLRRFDGIYRWFLVRTVPVRTESGEIINWYGSSTDITELKQTQEDLYQLNAMLEHRVQERTADLERSNRELDKFAYIASHDLKSPLRAIENLAHWVDEDAGALLPEAAKGHLERLQGRVKRMERLLDDLLAYSRAGRYPYNTEKVNLKTILQDTIDLLAPPPEFQFMLDIQAPIYIGQRVPLETVLRNLVGNAIKHHTRPDGHVWVTAQDQGDQIELVVRDDGPGIAPKFHDKVFEMFQTLQPRDRVEGSGMGLAIVKKLIEGLGGMITLESQEGAGATFRVFWPKK